jgi:uncharacterized phage-associated protein
MAMAIQSKDTVEKLGNAMVFFASKLGGVGKTKMLKLLYLLEECSAKKYQAPFFCIPFQVWKLGPVAKDVFIDLSGSESEIFKDFITLESYKNVQDQDNVVIKAKSNFNDDEFSDNDMDILEYVLRSFGHKNGAELVNCTHNKNSAWNHIAYRETNLGFLFDKGTINSSDKNIDFTYYLSGCASEKYRDILEASEFMESFE